MSKSIKFVVQTAIATIIGIITLVVFMGIVVLTLEPIINFLFPPLPPCPPIPEGATNYSYDYPCYNGGMWGDAGQNLDKYVGALFILYFVGICIAGFISGFYVNISKLRENAGGSVSYIWQSLISGSIIGAFIPFLLEFVLSNRQTSIGTVPGVLFLGVPAAYTALIGYKFRSYKQELTTEPMMLLSRLTISTFIGLIVFVGLRVIFNPIVGADYSFFKPTPGLYFDVRTESKVSFGIILFLACFISGWWSNAKDYFGYGAVSGFVVGSVGPLMGSYLDSRPTPVIFFLFYGMLGGLYGLVGNVCYTKYRNWRYGTPEDS